MKNALRALLSGTVDYAGLFPPTGLQLDLALANYAAYVRAGDAWMLGTFILPVEKFGEASRDLSGFNVDHRLRVSALGSKTGKGSEFLAALHSTADAIRAFEAENGAIAGVTQLEIPVASQPGASIGEAEEALAGLEVPVFFESPVDEAERTIASLAEHARPEGAPAFGFKLRTGGVVASAFPSSVQIAKALVAAIAHGVPIKFTAGLHHPVRLFHPSVQAKMHGFLNVFGAGVLAAEHHWDVSQTAAMLEDEDPSAFTVNDDGFAWNEWMISAEKIAVHRVLVTSFGSCSFDEPREDLRALNLLPQ